MRETQLGKLSVEIGKPQNYFYQMKRRNAVMFEEMLRLGDDNLQLGYEEYIKECGKKTDRFLENYALLELGRNVTAFANSIGVKSTYIAHKGFKLINSNIQYSTYLTLDDLSEKMELFIENNPIRK